VLIVRSFWARRHRPIREALNGVSRAIPFVHSRNAVGVEVEHRVAAMLDLFASAAPQ